MTDALILAGLLGQLVAESRSRRLVMPFTSGA